MSATLVAILFAAGLALGIVALAPGRAMSVFVPQRRIMSLRDRMQRTLRLAGVFEDAPMVVIIAILGGMVTAGLFFGVLLGSILFAIAGALAVPVVAWYVFNQRRRQFLDRVGVEIVPFLNRISTAAVAGLPVSAAYVNAVEEAYELKRVLAPSAARITAGARFQDALLDTLDVLPMRSWSIFVRQLELHAESGGDIATGIEKTIEQVNQIVMLQSEARADFASQIRQQKLLVFITVGFIVFFTVTYKSGLMSILWTTPAGIAVLIAGIAIMTFGIWFGRRQLRDIERKLDF